MTGSHDRFDTGGRDAVTEFDLLAYADGRLEDDAARRACVERYLAAHPDQAERVRAFEAQNEALRRMGAARLEEPVPERLLEVVRRDRRSGVGTPLKAAAVAALVVVSAAGGWLVGVDNSQDERAIDAFASGALLDYRQAPDEAAGLATGFEPSLPRPRAAANLAGKLPANDLAPQALLRQGMAPITWLRQRIAVEIEAPDLADQGFHLAETRKIVLNDEPALRLVYQDAGGQRANVYLRPRWQEGAERIREFESDRTMVLHWLDGPLAVALVAEGPPAAQARALARRVGDAVEQATLVEPSPEAPVSQDAHLTPAPQEVHQFDGALSQPGDPQL